ncbi:hypothetical protein GLYMA_07G110802v4 [Glycine max]|nr:hypothetical protein GLYMA_07G110802v4 [Glycine max]KAH1086345.1 hypothetical protein GYH30_018045 [Glycine max]
MFTNLLLLTSLLFWENRWMCLSIQQVLMLNLQKLPNKV